MKNVSTPRRGGARRMSAATLPLFDWAEAQHGISHSPLLPRAAHIVARRFGLSPSLACAVATLAGFRLEAP